MVSNLTFIHAADIHLDSPLHGLSRKDEAFSRLVRGATRKALSNVVDLAIEEGAAFVVIAGDLYDGTWKPSDCPVSVHWACPGRCTCPTNLRRPSPF